MAKILVADDNSNIQKMVGLALKDQGIDVVAVGNGEAAVRKISDLKPDLVLADVFMPVRNGYEVCKYVKDDPALSHIPVILLVGAFDPLDEQEAQRVGADGVLKKPFVPPDPLISMVKSALARAGVPLGHPAAEKTPDPAKRSAADLLSPAASKLAALTAATKLPEPEIEPFVENFATLPEQVKIPEGNELLAFGSLLDTPELEEDAAFMPAKPPTELSGGAHEWGKEDSEDDEVAEEESSGAGWRPGGDLDKPSLSAIDAAEVESQVADWREAAFHGNSPSKPGNSRGWAPAIDDPAHAEAASTRTSVGVTTLEPVKPVEAPAFSGDAWAAAMAAGVEEKAAESQEVVAEMAEVTDSVASSHEAAEAAPAVEEKAAEPLQMQETPKEVAPDNGWYSVSASPWEVEAKKATMLAATWDSAIAEEPSREPIEEVAASHVLEAVAPQVQEEIREVVQEVVAEPEPLQHVSAYAQIDEVAHAEEEVAPTPVEEQAATPATHFETNVNDTQEIDAFQTGESKSWEDIYPVPPAEIVNQFLETPRQEFAEAEQAEESAVEGAETVAESSAEVSHVEPEPAAEAVEETAPAPEAQTVTETAAPPNTNMDELVARVLARMNPDVLQRVTREILKPVIEAIVQDEINSKKQ